MTTAPANAVEQHIAAWIEDAAAGVMADQAAELVAKDALIADLVAVIRAYRCPVRSVTNTPAQQRGNAYVTGLNL